MKRSFGLVVAATLLAEDASLHFETMRRYAEPELLGDEWTPAAFPTYEPAADGR